MFLAHGLDTESAILVFDLGIIILSGLVMGRIAEMFKIPAVTGYLIGGLIIGPITGLVDIERLATFQIISDVALGFIAYQVGNELWLGKLRDSGLKIIIITVIQAVGTTLIVLFGLLFFTALPVALVLGAIAAATAPAPIMMIVKKYKTKGDLTDTIIPVVGLDDAVGVIIFGILLAVAVSLSGTDATGLHPWNLLQEPIYEIGLSILIGSICGLLTGFAIRTIDHTSEREEKNLDVIVIAILICTGLSLYFGASPILTPMIAGAFVTNLINKETYKIEEKTITFFVPPLMIAFFTIAGAQLQFSVLLSVGMIGIVYIVGRIIGKMLGAYIGCKLVHSKPDVQRYLGISLLPQSGVAIGLSTAAYVTLVGVNEEYALIIRNVVLAAVLFFALFGPVLVKTAFVRTKETLQKEKE